MMSKLLQKSLPLGAVALVGCALAFPAAAADMAKNPCAKPANPCAMPDKDKMKKGMKKEKAANPCAKNPCAVKPANPCAVKK